MRNVSVQTQTFHQQTLCISLYLHLLTQLHVNAGLVLQTAINTQHTRAMDGWILIFLIEIISLYLPKASFVAFLPFKSSYSWAQFAFERCQDNALLKYCTETVHKISHVQQISILLRIFFSRIIPHFCHSPVLRSSLVTPLKLTTCYRLCLQGTCHQEKLKVKEESKIKYFFYHSCE